MSADAKIVVGNMGATKQAVKVDEDLFIVRRAFLEQFLSPDTEDCVIDHDEYCQQHNFVIDNNDGCPEQQLRALLNSPPTP